MKRFGFIIIIGVGLLVASCGNNNSNSSKNQDVTDVNKELTTTPKTQKPVQRPKDLEPLKKGEKRVVVAKPKSSNDKSSNNKSLTLDNAIESFNLGVNAAKNCQELMTACRTFDSNVKKLSQKDKTITIASVEKRQDVRDIRKASEEKSLQMCQTQKMVK